MLGQIWQWLQGNSKTIADFTQTIALLFTLVFTYIQLRRTDQSNRSLIALEVRSSHREVWKLLFEDHNLSRILETNPDIDKHPPSAYERLFVVLALNQISAMFEASKQKMYFIPPVYSIDIADFFNLPIPRRVWEETKKYRTHDFVTFIDTLLNTTQKG